MIVIISYNKQEFKDSHGVDQNSHVDTQDTQLQMCVRNFQADTGNNSKVQSR